MSHKQQPSSDEEHTTDKHRPFTQQFRYLTNLDQAALAMKSLHRTVVTEAVWGYTPRIRLNGWPPPEEMIIDLEETKLPRATRTKLTKLRSGFSPLLNNYMSRIKKEIVDKCPTCHQSPQCPTPVQLPEKANYTDISRPLGTANSSNQIPHLPTSEE